LNLVFSSADHYFAVVACMLKFFNENKAGLLLRNIILVEILAISEITQDNSEKANLNRLPRSKQEIPKILPKTAAYENDFK